MADKKCIACGSTVRGETPPYPGLAGLLWINCPVCGPYGYSFRAGVDIQEAGDKVAAILTERNLSRHPPVFIVLQREGDGINQMTLEEILSFYPRSASEVFNRVLLNFGAKAAHPCDQVVVRVEEYPILFARAKRRRDDIETMVNQLTSLGYVRLRDRDALTYSLELTPAGWSKIEGLRQGNTDSRQAFVAMWFSPQTEDIFRDGIKPAIEEDNEYRAVRVDLEEHNNKICDQIILEIRRSRFVVADFTENRGGVYFEAGFAKGLGIPVIWTVRKDDLDTVHFDTRQYNHIDYENPAELRERLKNRIRATIV